MPSTRSRSTSHGSPDAGNALLGFAIGAPLIGLMLVTVVEMSGVVWQRELTAELLRRSVSSAARLGGDQSAAATQFRIAAAAAGLAVSDIRWVERSVEGARLLSGNVKLLPVGITLLPGLALELAASSVIE